MTTLHILATQQVDPETHHCNMQKEFLMPHIIFKILQTEQQSYAACTAQKSDHNNDTWQGCNDLSL
jgi:hypothetical protein